MKCIWTDKAATLKTNRLARIIGNLGTEHWLDVGAIPTACNCILLHPYNTFPSVAIGMYRFAVYVRIVSIDRFV